MSRRRLRLRLSHTYSVLSSLLTRSLSSTISFLPSISFSKLPPRLDFSAANESQYAALLLL